jgi:hypothetical protein
LDLGFNLATFYLDTKAKKWIFCGLILLILKMEKTITAKFPSQRIVVRTQSLWQHLIQKKKESVLQLSAEKWKSSGKIVIASNMDVRSEW